MLGEFKIVIHSINSLNEFAGEVGFKCDRCDGLISAWPIFSVAHFRLGPCSTQAMHFSSNWVSDWAWGENESSEGTSI